MPEEAQGKDKGRARQEEFIRESTGNKQKGSIGTVRF